MADETYGYYEDEFWGSVEQAQRGHLLRGGGMGKEVADVREDLRDSFSRLSLVFDRGPGHGSRSVSDTTPSEDLSGGILDQFNLDVDGAGGEEIILAGVATLDSAAKIVAAMNVQFRASSVELIRRCEAMWDGAQYTVVGPYHIDGSTMSVVITDGAANSCAAALKIGVANGGTETVGVQSTTLTPAGSVGTDSVTNDSGVAGATASAALDQLDGDIGGLDSDDIANASGVAGATTSAALDQNATDIGINAAAILAMEQVVGAVASVDLKDPGTTDYTIALTGTAGKKLVPTKVAIELDAGVLVTGDGKIKIGLSLGGEEVLAELTLTGQTAVGEVFIATPADGVRDVDADATIHVQVSGPDSGTSGEATVTVIGYEV